MYYNVRKEEKNGITNIRIQAENKDDLMKKLHKAYGDGIYKSYTKAGRMVHYMNINEKTMKRLETKRPYLPKDQYDQLFYYVEENGIRAMRESGRPPQDFASRKRYDTLDEVRKGALNKSKSIWKTYLEYVSHGWDTRGINTSVSIFKGNKYLGFVTCNELPELPGKGTFSPASNPKDEIPINADGSVYRGVGTVRRRL